MSRTPLEAYAFDARFGKRSVFILDPRLQGLPFSFPELWYSLSNSTPEKFANIRRTERDGTSLKERKFTFFKSDIS